MKSLEHYWNKSYQRLGLKPTFDNWLDKYWKEYISTTSDADLIVDLGCGVGNNAKYLVEHGLSPIACDISEEAIRTLKSFLPDIQTLCLDMTEGLPFPKDSVQVLIADLSIHYFDEATTHEVIRDLHNVLKTEGILLCRLNSTNEMSNKGNVMPTTDRYLMESEGIYRRFFDREEIERFFDKEKWTYLHMEEYEMDRYTKKKMLWEIALKPRW
ncbi:methyltransferase domain-containing protein [Paenibacillus sp. LMG 31461]|uniref:Methyltransferase domain-containing protein n=1 Tax=Paenibacillus plantarum TaxID=2654975 RepID=A0ABX1X8M8_9BACL|nr:class I SAM-dependent methyltransferase [Paenibacillus plantarum]NOU64792.1 methyltransferase domain-containing protein [Paenibacillus plantarum]